jgi:NhaP-type Na+/H+ or K+/H+ antiporter
MIENQIALLTSMALGILLSYLSMWLIKKFEKLRMEHHGH